MRQQALAFPAASTELICVISGIHDEDALDFSTAQPRFDVHAILSFPLHNFLDTFSSTKGATFLGVGQKETPELSTMILFLVFGGTVFFLACMVCLE
jgi:hypothetical protein